MIGRLIQPLVLCVAVIAGIPDASAQERPREPQCRFYRIQSSTLDVSKEPRADAASTDVPDNADVVCVTREQSAGGHNWGFVEHKLAQRGLTTSPPAAAPAPAAPQPPPAAAAAPDSDEVVRFDEPLKTGPPPVNGHSLEQLVQGVPLFPPIEGLDESLWKKNCNTCHKWDRRTLCEQGATYLKNPKMALRGSHPYGGPEKVAIMQWAKTGCQ
jgi:hypothetical protein